jgi:AcrR family transcriptional regulator
VRELTDIERSLYKWSMRQGDRKAETRTRLLEAAAEMFATHGIAGASVDAIAERAGRTVGGLYGHFASKEELLFAVVDEWLADAATVVAAELELARTADERLGALWRAVSQNSAHRWISVEHEVWSYAIRNPSALERLRARYHEMWQGIATLPELWPDMPGARDHGPAIIGVLFGLSMMHRIDPDALTEQMAIAALHGLIEPTTSTAPIVAVEGEPLS